MLVLERSACYQDFGFEPPRGIGYSQSRLVPQQWSWQELQPGYFSRALGEQVVLQVVEVAPFFVWQHFCEVALGACGEEHEHLMEVELGPQAATQQLIWPALRCVSWPSPTAFAIDDFQAPQLGHIAQGCSTCPRLPWGPVVQVVLES